MKSLRPSLVIAAVLCLPLEWGGNWAAAYPNPYGCDQQPNSVQIPVAKEDGNGVWFAGWITLPLPQFGTAVIHNRFGAYGRPCNTGKQNCKGKSYAWTDLQLDNGFQLTAADVRNPSGPHVSYTIADVEAFFEHSYPNQAQFVDFEPYLSADGWEKVDPADLNVNCHGYAFDKDCWLEGGADGMLLMVDDANPPPACYPPALNDNTKYAYRTNYNHSSKMKLGFFEDPNTGLTMLKAYERQEKSGQSAIYKLSRPGWDTPPDVRGAKPYAGDWALRKDP